LTIVLDYNIFGLTIIFTTGAAQFLVTIAFVTLKAIPETALISVTFIPKENRKALKLGISFD